MKRSDIPARKPVAYKAQNYSVDIEPAYVLDTERLWTYARPYSSDARRWSTSTETKFKRVNNHYSGTYGNHGFLTVVIQNRQFDERGREIAMSEIESLISELPSPLMADDVRQLESTLPSYAWLGVVNNLRLVGEWLPALEEQTAARKVAEEQRALEDEKREKFRDLRAEIDAAVDGHGLESWRIRSAGDGRLSIPASMLAKLLGVETEES